jgi:beta-barrel assembly-enhancing protease
VPGGHIFITSQTILSAEDESELAGVVAHEMGHVDGRHIAHRIDSAGKLSIATMAAILAAAFLSKNSPQAGTAIASFAVAGAETKMLQYSRADEEDSDRRALRTMVAAGYDGWGLVRFMETMHRQSPAPDGVPAYLFTHPLPDSRATYLAELLPGPRPRERDASGLGRLWRAQARALAQDPRPWGLSTFEERVRRQPESVDARLGLAVLLKAAGRYDQALEQLAAAQKLAADDPELAHESASIRLRQGRAEEAVALLEELRSEGRATAPALMDLGWAYLEKEQGARALEVYDDVLRSHPEGAKWEKFDYWRGMALGRAGREGEAHAALGDYHRKRGETALAARHYRLALQKLPPGSLKERVETESRELKPTPRNG